MVSGSEMMPSTTHEIEVKFRTSRARCASAKLEAFFAVQSGVDAIIEFQKENAQIVVKC